MAGNEPLRITIRPKDARLPPGEAGSIEGRLRSSLNRFYAPPAARQAQGNLIEAETSDPDAAARTMRLSEQSGLPVPLVEGSEDSIEKELRRSLDLDALLDSPATQTFLSKASNAVLARDSVSYLTGIENALERGWLGIQQAVTQLRADSAQQEALASQRSLRAILTSAQAGTFPVAAAEALSRRAAANPPEAEAERLLQRTGELRRQMSALPYSDTSAGLLASLQAAEAGGFGDMLSVLAADPAGTFQLGTEIMAESIAPLASAAAVTAAGGGWLAPVAAGAVSFGLERYRTPSDFFASRGYDIALPEQARAVLANPDLLREAESRGFRRGAIIGAIDTATGGMARIAFGGVFRNFLTQTAIQAAGGGGGEALATLATGDEISKTDVLLEMLGEAVGTVPEIIAMGGSKAQGAAAAKAAASKTKQAVEAAKESPLAARSPATAAEHLGEVFAAQGVENVWVPVDVLDDATNGAWTEWPLKSGSEWTTGGDVRLPVEQFAEKLLTGEIPESMIDQVKLTAEGMSAADADELLSESVSAPEVPKSREPQPATQAMARKSGDKIVSGPLMEAVTLAEEQLGLKGIIDTGAQLGLTEKQTEAQLATILASRRKAEKRLLAQIDKIKRSDLAAQMRQFYKAALQYEKEKASEQVPVYALLNNLGKDRFDQAKVLEVLRGDEARLAQLPQIRKKAIYSPNGTLDPHLMAQLYDFPSAEEMLARLTAAPTLHEYAKAQAERATAEAFASRAAELDIQRAALEQTLTDEIGALLVEDMNRVREARAQGRLSLGLIRETARNEMEGHIVSDILPAKYLATFSRLQKQAGAAIRKGDLAEAARLKTAAMMNFEYARAAFKIQVQMQAWARELRKLANTRRVQPGMDADALARVHDTLRRYSFAPARQSGDDRPRFTDLTLEAATALYTAVQAGLIEARAKKSLFLAGQEKQLAEVVSALVEQSAGLRESASGVEAIQSLEGRPRKWWTPIASLESTLLNAQTLFKKMDGGVFGGLWGRTLDAPLKAAEERANALSHDRLAPLFIDLWELSKQQNLTEKTVTPGGVGQEMSGLNRLMLALNYGNPSNWQRALQGHGWTEDAALAELARITPEQADWVQSVWSFFDSLYPDLVRIYRSEKGIDPKKVEPWTVTLGGKELEGGYIPMLYDHLLNGITPEMQASGTGAIHNPIRKTVDDSMTHSRKGPGGKVTLDPARLIYAMRNLIHYVTHYEPVREVRKVLNQPEIKETLLRHAGPDSLDVLEGWITALATNNASTPHEAAANQVYETIRKNATLAILLFRLTTVMKQPLGALSSAAALSVNKDGTLSPDPTEGIRRFAQGAKIMLRDPAAVETALKASIMLQQRVEHVNLEAQENLERIQLEGANFKNRAARLGFHLIAYTQLYTVDIPTWIAAWNQAREWGRSEQEAVYYADTLVEQTQGSAVMRTLSRFQREKGLARLASTWATFTSARYRQLRDLGSAMKTDPAVNSIGAVTGIFMALVLQEMLGELLSGRGPETDDDSWALEQMAKYAWQAVPIGALANPAALSPSMRHIERAARKTERYLETGDLKYLPSMALEAGYVAGVVTGVPGTAAAYNILRAAQEDAPWYEMITGPLPKK